ncbi:MAG: pyridoxal-phosphate dependent enzyme, partial [Spirochaetales bacterium]
MRIVSTRNSKNTEASSVSFKEAVFKGLAPDGGLYHVADNPDLKKVYAGFGAETGFNAMAEKVTEALFHDEFSTEAARRVVERAFTFAPVLRRLDASISLLELFHGPSFAFKDFGASFLASVMEEYLRNDARRAVILTATSGDTGSAVARAFYGKKNIDVVILYPSGRVSPLQEKQLTTLGGNVAALEVKGSFDDCQRMVKEVFVDAELSNGL